MDPSVVARLHNLYWSLGTVAFIVVGSALVGQLARRVAAVRGGSVQLQRRTFWGYAMASPWILGFVIFVLGPSLASLYYSLTDYKLGQGIEWSGLDNYRTLLGGLGAHGRRFMQAMYNSFYYAVVGVPLQIATSLVMAMLVVRALPGMRLFRLVFYLPVILAGGPAILLAWRYMLASNGGFVNVTLTSLADAFVPFDWLYRTWIFCMEAFNAFYAGLARNDPTGPLMYLVPALVGLVLCTVLALVRDDTVRRSIAATAGEILVALVALALLRLSLLDEAGVDPGLVSGFGMLAWLALARRGTATVADGDTVRIERAEVGQAGVGQAGVGQAGVGQAAVGQAGARQAAVGQAEARQAEAGQAGAERHRASGRRPLLLLTAAIAAAVPVVASVGDGSARPYLLGAALVAVPSLLAATVPALRQGRLLTVAGVANGVYLLARLVPGQLDDGRLTTLFQLATLRSALRDPGSLDYLRSGFAAHAPSALWLVALLALVVVAVAAGRLPRSGERGLLAGGAVLCGLLTVGSVIDGLTYFAAYDAIATATGTVNHHFSLFRQATAQFPDSDRVPLWLGNELWSKPSLILITMWSSGAGMLIFLAALKGVPRVFYEAAEVDGATAWQRFARITLPLISPAMFYNVVIGIIAALQTFEAVYIIQNTQTEQSLSSAAYFLFVRTFRQLEIGQGAAASWILAVIIVILTIAQFRYSRWVHYS